MLCGSKCDLRSELEATGQACLSREQGETLARQFGAFFHETSAKTGEGMMEAIVELGRSEKCAQIWPILKAFDINHSRHFLYRVRIPVKVGNYT